MMPPSTAPGRLPMPPMTTTQKALTTAHSPMVGSIVNIPPRSPPATPAIPLPTAKVIAYTRSTGMPIKAAASRLPATARIAMPHRVRRMNHVSAMMSAAPTASTARRRKVMTTPPRTTGSPPQLNLARVWSPHEQRPVLEEDREPERREHDREHVTTLERPHRESLGEPPRGGGADDSQRERNEIVETKSDRQAVGQEGAEHVELAVSEVDDAEDAEHEREADGDECVHHADGDAVDDLLQKDGRHASGGDDVTRGRDRSSRAGRRRRRSRTSDGAPRRGRRGPVRGVATPLCGSPVRRLHPRTPGTRGRTGRGCNSGRSGSSRCSARP